jgi:DNA-binding protein H-NS
MTIGTRDLEALSIDDLSRLYEEIGLVLTRRIEEEKSKLEKQLARLVVAPASRRGIIRAPGQKHEIQKARRPYPPVLPKFRDPDTKATWAGRGKKPRWLVAKLRAGRKLEDFRIGSKPRARASRRS